MKRKQIIIGAGILFVLLFVGGLRASLHTSAEPVHTAAVQTVDAFSYKGATGKDALTLLKAKTTVEQAQSGLVIRIGNKTVEDKKHEFWAFYVNGKEAQVGPASYQTKDGDTILWKIKTY